MARFGLEDLVADHSGATVEAIVATVDRVLQDAPAVRAAIKAALPGVTAAAQEPLAGLLDPDLGVARAARSRP
jgi:methyl coenzyme M reductase beta subunit